MTQAWLGTHSRAVCNYAEVGIGNKRERQTERREKEGGRLVEKKWR